MRVFDLMTRDVATIREWDELGLSSDLMRFRRFRHLPVVDARDRVVGILSRMDLVEQASRPGNPRLVPVYEAMKRPPITVRATASIEEAAELMRRFEIHSLPVVDEEGVLEGILTDSDLLAAVAGVAAPVRDVGSLLVARVMTSEPITIGTDATLGEAAGMLLEGGFRHLPVIDADGRLAGMLSERDLRSAFGTDFLDWTTVDQDLLDDVVANVMVPEPVVVRANNRLVDILDVFTDERIGAVPVLDDEDRLVGILSYVDVLQWLRKHARTEVSARAEPSPWA
ncbi:MAG TPA: CBS domain-containing protein [Vulgatibacter sp.]|nr:CBS domain-containing protein [Vulgatibacter sp.]